MKTINSILAFLILSVGSLSAQNNNQAKEEVAITKAVVNQLFAKRSDSEFYFRDGDTKVNYYPGYGFLINAAKLNDGNAMYFDGFDAVTINGRKYPAPNIDSLVSVRQKKITDVIRQYYVNYAKLITSLQPGEKIRLNYDHWIVNNQFASPLASTSKNNKGTSNFKGIYAEMSFEQLENFRQGKLSKDELMTKVEIKYGNTIEPTDDTEFSIMANILKNLLDKERGTYGFCQVKFNYISGLGVVYNCNLHRNPVMRFRGSNNMTTVPGAPRMPSPPSPPMAFKYDNSAGGSVNVEVYEYDSDEKQAEKGKKSRKEEASKSKYEADAKKSKVIIMDSNSSSVVDCDEIEESKTNARELKELNRDLNKLVEASTRVAMEAATAEMNGLVLSEDEEDSQLSLDSIANHLKAPILRYAATLGSLKEGEMIIIKLDDYSENEITLSLPVTVVRKLERREITQEEALRQFRQSR